MNWKRTDSWWVYATFFGYAFCHFLFHAHPHFSKQSKLESVAQELQTPNVPTSFPYSVTVSTIFSFSIVIQNLILASVVICELKKLKLISVSSLNLKLKAKSWRVFFLFSLVPQSWPSVSSTFSDFNLLDFKIWKQVFLLMIEFKKEVWFKLSLSRNKMSFNGCLNCYNWHCFLGLRIWKKRFGFGKIGLVLMTLEVGKEA